MGDMLSQAEIDALLNGTADSLMTDSGNDESSLTPQEIDALGEIGNISMGTSATTLFTLLGQKVTITTPKVTITNWEDMSKEYTHPLVAVKVEYTHGLTGSNLLVLKENDAKIITDLMMGGEGNASEGSLTDLHLSAISEAMNQMVGSSATSMSSMFDKRIDISPPRAFSIQFDSVKPEEFSGSDKVVKIAFKMVIGSLIDSEIMQILPLPFAKSLVDNLLNAAAADSSSQEMYQTPPPVSAQPQQYAAPAPQTQSKPPQPQQVYYEHNDTNDQPEIWGGGANTKNRNPVNVQPAHFQSFEDERFMIEKKNISLIMDVPLQVTVELGRTHRMIKDILEFGPGSIIELDKLAGEPVDILVNGKSIAKGEVVVIDESFGVRIIDIIHPSKRL